MGECSGGAVRSRGAFGANQSSGLLNHQISKAGSLACGRGDFNATGRAHKRSRVQDREK